MNKLSFHEVLEAKELLDAGGSHLGVARQFEAGKSTMRDIKNRTKWGWTDKLGSDDDKLIIGLIESGLTFKQTGDIFELTYRQVAAVYNSFYIEET